MKKILIAALIGTVVGMTLPVFGNPAVVVNSTERFRRLYRAEQQYFKDVVGHGSCWYLNYTLTTEILLPGGKSKTVNTNGSLYATRTVRCVTTNTAETYLDARDVFTLFKTDKTLMRTRSSPKALAINDQYNQLLSDSILTQYTIVKCEPILAKDGALLRFELKGNPEARYTKLVVIANDSTKSFIRFSGEGNQRYSKEIKSFDLIIADRGSKMPDVSWSDLRSKFLSAGGKVKPPYEKYRLMDLTRKEKKIN